jgi:hypothetical protein
MRSVVEKYLAQYAELEVQALRQRPASAYYKQVLVIPACNESAGFLKRVPRPRQPILLIVVINQAPQAKPQVAAANRRLARSVRAFGQTLWSVADPVSMALYRSPSRPFDLLLVDRFSPGHEIPVDGGVGQARKIGADLALSMIEAGLVDSPWIHNTDADTELPASYFESGQIRHAGAAALLFPFKHRCDLNDPVGRATQLYEFSLFYYVAGLRWARSPYAFHTVGSSFAVHAKRYAQVRGFPKRVAAEDFYMLNKLAKVAPIVELDCAPITIKARTSERVPFGTGAAVGQMLKMQDPVRDYSFYHPQVFACLQACQSALAPLWDRGSPGRSALLQTIQAQGSLPLSPARLVGVLGSVGMPKALEHAFRQSKDSSQFERQFHSRFDAFRTLKLIHLLRDDFFPSMPLQNLLVQQFYSQIAGNDPRLGCDLVADQS